MRTQILGIRNNQILGIRGLRCNASLIAHYEMKLLPNFTSSGSAGTQERE